MLSSPGLWWQSLLSSELQALTFLTVEGGSQRTKVKSPVGRDIVLCCVTGVTHSCTWHGTERRAWTLTKRKVTSVCLRQVENRIADREGCGSVPCKAASGLRQGGLSCKTRRGLHGAEEAVGPGASTRVQHALSGKAVSVRVRYTSTLAVLAQGGLSQTSVSSKCF